MKFRYVFFLLAALLVLFTSSCRKQKQSCAAYDKVPVEQVK
ncbi:MAG: hypothetical protein ACK57W_06225 [Flavobacteriales bacterium]